MRLRPLVALFLVVASGAAGYSMSAAPLVIKDKVIVGTAGGEFGIRGFLAAYDAARDAMDLVGTELRRAFGTLDP